jgi:quinolinate synthase
MEPIDRPDPSQEQTLARLRDVRNALGEDVIILVHHYQRDEVVRFADFVGDSLELSREAAQQDRPRYIVFCGVDFMAETAAMLCKPGQTVLIPERSACCPMSAMVHADDAAVAWQRLTAAWGDDITPITYQNSDAQMKAFCGKRGGAVCTSANAQDMFGWALAQRGHILFFPDEHLGTNSALALGFKPEEIAVWDPRAVDASAERGTRASVVVWRGYCHVHTNFTVEHVRRVREEHPFIRVVVHPECPAPVVQAADGNGSTGYLVRAANETPVGSALAIGTEINLVNRLARRNPGKTIIPLARSLCGAMYRINEQNLLATLESIRAGRPQHVVTVDPDTTRWANEALQRMLARK